MSSFLQRAQIKARWHLWHKRMALLRCGWLRVVPIELLHHFWCTTLCCQHPHTPFAKAATAATFLLRILLFTSKSLGGRWTHWWTHWRWREWQPRLRWIAATMPFWWRGGASAFDTSAAAAAAIAGALEVVALWDLHGGHSAGCCGGGGPILGRAGMYC